jgi:hypothetical protein
VFSRPYGTHWESVVLTQTLFPSLFTASQQPHLQRFPSRLEGESDTETHVSRIDEPAERGETRDLSEPIQIGDIAIGVVRDRRHIRPGIAEVRCVGGIESLCAELHINPLP